MEPKRAEEAKETIMNRMMSKYANTSLLFLNPIAAVSDKKAFLGQDLIHSEMLGIATARPPFKTKRFRYTDPDRPPTMDGSEFVISKPMSRWDGDDQATYLNADLRAHYEEHTSGVTISQIRKEQSRDLWMNIIMGLFVGIWVMGFGVVPLLYDKPASPYQDANAPVGVLNPIAPTGVQNPEPAEEAPREQTALEKQLEELQRELDDFENNLDNVNSDSAPPNVDGVEDGQPTPVTQGLTPGGTPDPEPVDGLSPERRAELEELMRLFEEDRFMAPQPAE